MIDRNTTLQFNHGHELCNYFQTVNVVRQRTWTTLQTTLVVVLVPHLQAVQVPFLVRPREVLYRRVLSTFKYLVGLVDNETPPLF